MERADLAALIACAASFTACDLSALEIFDSGASGSSDAAKIQDARVEIPPDAGSIDANEVADALSLDATETMCGDAHVQDSGACPRCGNGVAEETEDCDRADLRGATCLSVGYRPGPKGMLACGRGCRFDPTPCMGKPIDTPAGIRAAITDAYATPGHEVIAIQPGRYEFPGTLYLSECADGCPINPPQGVTLRPVSGVVELTLQMGVFDRTLIEVRSPGNVIEGLRLVDVPHAIVVREGAPHTALRGNFVHNMSVAPMESFEVRASFGEIVANRIVNESSGVGDDGVYVSTSTDTTIAMNAVFGRYGNGISLEYGPGRHVVDHNSVWMPSGTGSGMRFRPSNALGVCYRNNIVIGNPSSTGIRLEATATLVACAPARSGNNVNVGSGDLCDGNGTQCSAFCDLGGAACDLPTDPGFTGTDLCLGASGHALADMGVPLLWDMWDDDPALFFGAGPDVGAREAGVSRAFGGEVSSCPPL